MTEEEVSQKDWDIDFALVLRPEGKLVMTSKLIYKIKHVVDGNIEMYKAWLVARGFSQQEGEEYGETLTPVTKEIVPIFMKTTRTTMIHI